MATTRRRSRSARKRPTTRKAPDDAGQVLEPAEEAAVAEAAPTDVPGADEPILTESPEREFAVRMPPPAPPRPRPDGRRGIFFDVENTSRPEDIEEVLRHLMIDRVGIATDFTAVGNWRVVGHETARLLARNGAHLVHSAPSVGVRDWSDLRIAVAAGVWLAAGRPGDMIDVVSDDQAFDAVGDVAASLGVRYRRLSYRALIGREAEPRPAATPVAGGSGRGRRRRRGGRREERREPHVTQVPHVAAPAAHVEAEADAHTAPHDEIVGVVRDLVAKSPAGVSLDQLANALRERGFRRTPGSPRLITRLKRIKELEVGRNGTIRLVDGGEPYRAPATHEPAFDIAPDEGGESDAAAPAEAAAAPAAGTGERRRRRRRGGRRRRGRRGGGGGASSEGGNGNGPDVVAASAPIE